MKKLLSSLALATTFIAAAPAANAATYNLGALDAGATFSSASTLSVAGTTDLFNFTLPSAGSLLSQGATLFFSIVMPAPFSNTLTFDGIFTDIKLLNSDLLPVGPSAVTTLAPDGKSFSFSAANLASGSYTLSITGNALATSAGPVTYGIAGTVSPVPEPESYAMMLAGLALMGAIARKRSQNKA